MQPTKQVIVVRKDLNMRKGKIAAQVAHASLGVFSQYMNIWKLDDELQAKAYPDMYRAIFYINEYAKQWFENSFTKICVSCDSEADLDRIVKECEAARIPHKLIIDNGVTEFNGVPTKTCIAVGPWICEEVDKITGGFKLL